MPSNSCSLHWTSTVRKCISFHPASSFTNRLDGPMRRGPESDDQEKVRDGLGANEPWKFYDLGHGYCTYHFLDRTTVGQRSLVALPRPLSAPASLSRTGAAVRKCFRPTASRTRGTKSETQKRNQTQIPCACRSPLEKTMEADISILRKTGHFYFALTLAPLC
jgi:hypothetical protein